MESVVPEIICGWCKEELCTVRLGPADVMLRPRRISRCRYYKTGGDGYKTCQGRGASGSEAFDVFGRPFDELGNPISRDSRSQKEGK